MKHLLTTLFALFLCGTTFAQSYYKTEYQDEDGAIVSWCETMKDWNHYNVEETGRQHCDIRIGSQTWSTTAYTTIHLDYNHEQKTVKLEISFGQDESQRFYSRTFYNAKVFEVFPRHGRQDERVVVNGQTVAIHSTTDFGSRITIY